MATNDEIQFYKDGKKLSSLKVGFTPTAVAASVEGNEIAVGAEVTTSPLLALFCTRSNRLRQTGHHNSHLHVRIQQNQDRRQGDSHPQI